MDSLGPEDVDAPVMDDEVDEADHEVGAGASLLLFPEHMVHRRLVDELWESCAPTDEGHQLDSRVHAYDRSVGFLRADQEMIDRNEDVRASYERRRMNPHKAKAHKQVVERWAIFERWVLARMPNEEYAAFLRACAELLTERRLAFSGRWRCMSLAMEWRARRVMVGSAVVRPTSLPTQT